ncbi:MAG: hypothetical protein WCK51_04770 [Armatimonadota bacterium]
MNETTGSVRHWYVSGRFQKAAIVVIVGGCLFGIGFQHYVRGPRMRLAKIESALSCKDWDAFAEAFPDSNWSYRPWSKSQMVAFMRHYVEPKLTPRASISRRSLMTFGFPANVIELCNSDSKPLVETAQYMTSRTVWSTTRWNIYFPLSWVEDPPWFLTTVRAVAHEYYPHPEMRDAKLAKSVSEYEFLVAERIKLEQMGIVCVQPKLGPRPATTFDDYLALIIRLHPKNKDQYQQVSAKYGYHPR